MAAMHNTEREAIAGTGAIRDVEEALMVIFDVVERQAKEAVSINELAGKQLYSANMVVRSMHATADTTRANNVHMNDAASHLQQLMWLVEQLRLSVVVFKLRNDLYDTRSVSPVSPVTGENSMSDFPSVRKTPRSERYMSSPGHVFSAHTPFPSGGDTKSQPGLRY
jgi:hypothetical protein